MITWVLGLIMMHLAIHLPRWHIVLMEQAMVHRLFSCGTNKEGELFLVEWNESKGAVRCIYHGLGKRYVGVVQFDTTKKQFLAAGDEYVIKFWDMFIILSNSIGDADCGLLVFSLY